MSCDVGGDRAGGGGVGRVGVGVVQGLEVFGQLEGRVDLLLDKSVGIMCLLEGVCTSCKSINGGPSAMSSALLPGCMRRSRRSTRSAWSNVKLVWSSAIGGGLGRRGEEAGDAIV